MRPLSGRKVIRAFERAGFVQVRTSGSHHILSKGEHTIAVPVHRSQDLKMGTLRGIIRKSGLSVEQFYEYVDE